jgi:hypothetical protein
MGLKIEHSTFMLKAGCYALGMKCLQHGDHIPPVLMEDGFHFSYPATIWKGRPEGNRVRDQLTLCETFFIPMSYIEYGMRIGLPNKFMVQARRYKDLSELFEVCCDRIDLLKHSTETVA